MPFELHNMQINGSLSNGLSRNFNSTKIVSTLFKAATKYGDINGVFTLTNLNNYFLKSQFQARSTIPRQGSDTDAILSRSEAFLKTNDLEKSLFELTQLVGIALKVMEPWRISAENRINSLLAVEQLVQSIEK